MKDRSSTLGQLTLPASEPGAPSRHMARLTTGVPLSTARTWPPSCGKPYHGGPFAGVTASLGVAFNSTFTALVISIIIMFLMHQLQLIQERLVLDTQTYCDQRLLRHLQVRNL